MHSLAATDGSEAIQTVLKFLGLIAGSVCALYIYVGIVLTLLAVKSNTRNAWLAWIPIANAFLLCVIARRSMATFILLLIPLVNLIAGVVLWMSVAENRGKPSWTGALVFIPIVGFLIPFYLIAGPKTDPDDSATPLPRNCPACGAAAQPSDVFCGECGGPLQPAPISAGTTRRTSALRLAAIGSVLVAVFLGGSGVLGWTAMGSMLVYTPPNRVAAAIPKRLAGVMKEFPIDTEKESPARPDAVVAETFSSGGGSSRVPASWLPKGVDRSKLPARAKSLTAATYRRKKADKPVAVTVLEPQPGVGNLGKTMGSEVSEAVGGKTTGISVDSSAGQTYTGVRVESSTVEVYVLQRQDNGTTIIVYAPDPSVFDTADRLAQNVGNGDGLVEGDSSTEPGDPVSPLFLLPADLPSGLELVSVQSLSADDVIGQEDLEKAESAAASDEQLRRSLALFKMLLPESWTVAEYRDGAGKEWKAGILDYGDSRRAWFAHQFFRTMLSAMDMEAVTVRDVEGRVGKAGSMSSLIFGKGPYIAIVDSPEGTERERIVEFGNGMQI